MKGQIKKHKRKDSFTVVNNKCLQDKNLSWRAKGLVVYIMGLPEDWRINISDLKNRSKDGRDSTARGLQELIENEYCLKTQLRSPKGVFMGYEYEISDEKIVIEPETENPYTVNPKTENPKTENPLLINTNSTKETDIGNTKGIKKTSLKLKNNSNEQRKKHIDERIQRAIEQSSSSNSQHVWNPE